VTKSDLAKNDAGWVIFVDSAQLQGAILAYFSAIFATDAFCRLPVTSLCSSQTRLHLVKIKGLSLRSRSALPTMISEWFNYRAQRRIEKLSQNPAGDIINRPIEYWHHGGLESVTDARKSS